MAEVRCPMCGKPNSADSDVCKYCQARLKPLVASSPTGDSSLEANDIFAPQGEESQPAELPDWLQSLRDSQDSGSLSNGHTGVTDWLSTLRESTTEESSEQESTEEIPSTEASFILPETESGISSELNAIIPDQSATAEETPLQGEIPQMREEPDWWLKIGGDQSADLDFQGIEAPKDAADWIEKDFETEGFRREEVPPWLSKESTESETEPDKLAETSGTELPGWMAGIAASEAELDRKQAEEVSTEGKEAIPGGGEAEFLEWLSQPSAGKTGLEAFQPDEAGEKPPVETSGVDVGAADWLATPARESEQPAGDGQSGVPDWLAGVEVDYSKLPGQEGQSETQLESQPSAIDSGVGLLGWLASMNASSPKELSQAAPGDELPGSESLAEQAQAELPDWLAGMESGVSEWPSGEDNVTSETGAASSEAGMGELPDWMVEAGIPQKTSPEDTGFQDWLFEAEKPLGEQAPSPEITESWDAFAAKQAIEEPTEGHEQFDFITEAADESGIAGVEEDLSWLNELEASFPEMSVSAETSEVGQEPGLVPAGEPETKGFEPVYGDALPTWLAEVAAAEEAPKPFVPEGAETSSDLSPADLPSWLEAMRPVAAIGAVMAVSEEAETGKIEGAGPLAGLKGVLPAETEIYNTTKPPVYSSKLVATDVQLSHVDLLAQLVKTEVEPQPVPGKPAITSQHILRTTIAILLILSFIVPMLITIPVAPPLNYFPEASAASQLVGGLSAGAPVLFAVDYQPGFSGEMNATIAGLMDHLMIKGAYLTFVSTLPTGAMQAETLIAQATHSGNHQYASPEQYINLGFIPGGATALASFAQSPRQILPVDANYELNQDETWSKTPLQVVNSLSNFSMVIVATEDPDKARAWIEQAGPYLGSTPLLLVVSSQAEPMVRPYYEAASKQVQGLVIGLATGVAYESVLGRKGMADTFWVLFSMGMWVAIIMIIIGGMVNLASSRLRRNKEKAEGEATG